MPNPPLIIAAAVGLLVVAVVLDKLHMLNEQRGRAVVQMRHYPVDAPGATATPTVAPTTTTTTLVNERPARDPKLESEVLVPLGVTIATTVIVGIVATIGAVIFNWSWRVPLGITGLTLAAVWLWRLRVSDSLLWIIENVINEDITKDGYKGKPPDPDILLTNTGTARSENQSDAQARLDRAAQDGVIAFVHKCIALQNSESSGTSEEDHGVDSPSQREKHNASRDILISLGLATWNTPSRHTDGWRLTADEARATDVIRRHVRAKAEAPKEYDR